MPRWMVFAIVQTGALLIAFCGAGFVASVLRIIGSSMLTQVLLGGAVGVWMESAYRLRWTRAIECTRSGSVQPGEEP